MKQTTLPLGARGETAKRLGQRRMIIGADGGPHPAKAAPEETAMGMTYGGRHLARQLACLATLFHDLALLFRRPGKRRPAHGPAPTVSGWYSFSRLRKAQGRYFM